MAGCGSESAGYSLRWFTDGLFFPLLQIFHWHHAEVELEQGRVEAVREGSGDGLAVEGGPFMLSVRVFVEKVLCLWTSLTSLS